MDDHWPTVHHSLAVNCSPTVCQVVMRCAQELPVDLFELLSEHLGVCGRECQRIRAKEQRRYRRTDIDRGIESTYQCVCHVLSRKFFNRVFGDCDPENVSLLDSPNLSLCHCFMSPPNTHTLTLPYLQTGSVNRLHMLGVFASYYDSVSPDTQRELSNPRQCECAT